MQQAIQYFTHTPAVRASQALSNDLEKNASYLLLKRKKDFFKTFGHCHQIEIKDKA